MKDSAAAERFYRWANDRQLNYRTAVPLAVNEVYDLLRWSVLPETHKNKLVSEFIDRMEKQTNASNPIND